MNKKVSLKEIVGTKIVYAIILTSYYWMWARRDWHGYYDNIQYAVAAFTFIFLLLQSSRIRKYNKEVADEMALANLKRADSICLKIALIASIVIAFTGAMELINQLQMGYIIMILLVVTTIVRTIIFYVMDTKGV